MDYNVQRIDAAKELNQIVDLLQRCFPESKKFSEAFLRWQYLDNPVGEVVGFNAYAGTELAAHYACIPVEYSIAGRVVKGLLSLNTATHPEHRGKRLFTKLAEATYDLAKSEGFEFVIGVANANSTHGFVNKLDFQLIGPLHVWIGLGKVKKGDDKACIHAHKPDLFWKWRLANPAQSYRVRKHYITTDKREKALAPILAFRPDFLSPEGGSLSGFKMWIGRNNHIRKKGVFVPLPDRFKPSPLNLIWKDLTGSSQKISPDSIELELIDFDAY